MDRREVEDHLRAVLLDQGAEGGIPDVGDDELDAVAQGILGAEAEVVDGDHLVAGL